MALDLLRSESQGVSVEHVTLRAYHHPWLLRIQRIEADRLLIEDSRAQDLSTYILRSMASPYTTTNKHI